MRWLLGSEARASTFSLGLIEIGQFPTKKVGSNKWSNKAINNKQ